MGTRKGGTLALARALGRTYTYNFTVILPALPVFTCLHCLGRPILGQLHQNTARVGMGGLHRFGRCTVDTRSFPPPIPMRRTGALIRTVGARLFQRRAGSAVAEWEQPMILSAQNSPSPFHRFCSTPSVSSRPYRNPCVSGAAVKRQSLIAGEVLVSGACLTITDD